jgi:hypothetical protein
MNLPAAIYAIRWLIRDTFRQSLATGIFWIMLSVTVLCVLLCLSVSVTGPAALHDKMEPTGFVARPPRAPHESDEAYQKRLADLEREAARSGTELAGGEMTLAFGLFHTPIGRDAADAVHFLELLLAGGVADAAGVLLALVWTAGFLPGFLDPNAASVLLAKPIPRWSLLFGKYLGVLVFVAFQSVLFVGGTWTALGLRTGIWDSAYLLAIPLLLVHFGIFFSMSTFLATCSRSVVTCILGSFLFWFLCWGMNYGRHVVVAAESLRESAAGLRGAVEVGYWVLPKPGDMSMLLFDALKAHDSFGIAPEFKQVQLMGAFNPELSLLTSVLFAVVLLGLSAWQFVTTDY